MKNIKNSNEETKYSIFIFRRDLRIEDNLGLFKALSYSEKVIPIFILNPIQIKKNPLLNKFAINFMIESLFDLNKELESKGGKLFLFEGKEIVVLKNIFSQIKVDKVFLNRDYTPFSIKRDEDIKKFCKKENVFFESCNDVLLNEPEKIFELSKKQYKKFSAFFNFSKRIKIGNPIKNNLFNYYSKKIRDEKKVSYLDSFYSNNLNSAVRGGREEGLKILNNISSFYDYSDSRNILKNNTTFLSSHNKFGTVSIREVYWKIVSIFGEDHKLIKQLYWRDFFYHIGFFYPNVFGNAFIEKYNNVAWEDNENLFSSWKSGKTGFPIVDAGIKELITTGFMHNRVRMIVASFLVKDLLVDWRLGEKFFAKYLIDYDPCVNNGNWQWCASTGTDAQPYFRIFNPWLQSKKFDGDVSYIKKWVPELRNLSAQEIHSLWKKKIKIASYPFPVVDHSIQSKKFIKLFSKGKKN